MKDKEQSKAEKILETISQSNIDLYGTPTYSKIEALKAMERYHAEKQRTDDRELLIRFKEHLESVPEKGYYITEFIIDEFLSGQIPAKESEVKGAPFDDPENFNPACDKCGHQNSVNCNTCDILNPQFR